MRTVQGVPQGSHTCCHWRPTAEHQATHPSPGPGPGGRATPPLAPLRTHCSLLPPALCAPRATGGASSQHTTKPGLPYGAGSRPSEPTWTRREALTQGSPSVPCVLTGQTGTAAFSSRLVRGRNKLRNRKSSDPHWVVTVSTFQGLAEMGETSISRAGDSPHRPRPHCWQAPGQCP